MPPIDRETVPWAAGEVVRAWSVFGQFVVREGAIIGLGWHPPLWYNAGGVGTAPPRTARPQARSGGAAPSLGRWPPSRRGEDVWHATLVFWPISSRPHYRDPV